MPSAKGSGAVATNTEHLRCAGSRLQASLAQLAGCRSSVYMTALTSPAPLLNQCPNVCRTGGSNSILLADQRQNLFFAACIGCSAPQSSRRAGDADPGAAGLVFSPPGRFSPRRARGSAPRPAPGRSRPRAACAGCFARISPRARCFRDQVSYVLVTLLC